MEPIIAARNLTKIYRLYRRPIDSLLELLLRRPRHTPFYALRDVSLTVQRGEAIGIIGDNGAGKSTLLKIISGTLPPTSGELTVRGRIAAILELGVGFHPELSGLENARLACALQGLSREETEEKLPSICAFAELGAFIHRPVKTYSSGMKVRLAFSIATCTDPDILIIDEALAVGDSYFQKKCIDRIEAFREAGKTLLFCSHSMYLIKQLCRRAIWLERGTLRMAGQASEVVEAYQEHVRKLRQKQTPREVFPERQEEPSAPLAWLEQVHLRPGPEIVTGERLQIQMVVGYRDLAPDDVHVAMVLFRSDGVECLGLSSQKEGVFLQEIGRGRLGATLEFPALPLLAGEYYGNVWLLDRHGLHVYSMEQRAFVFRVRQPETLPALGLVWLEHRWRTP